MTLEELRAEAQKAIRAKDDDKLCEIMMEIKAYHEAYPQADDEDYEEEVLEEEDYEPDYSSMDDDGYEYDDEGYPHYVEHESWEQRAFRESGMTWADFI